MWQLGSFRLDPLRLRLTDAGVEVALQRRPIELLIYLVSERGRVVPRKDLIESVWGGVSVSPGAINQALYEVRSAIGDDARSAADRWVKTIRGRGIRFDGPAETLQVSFEAADGLAFVGRADVSQRLRAAAEGITQEHGSIHMIRGPAGMGKTRLMQEVTRDVAHARVHLVQCFEDSPAYSLIDEIAEELTDGLEENASVRDLDTQREAPAAYRRTGMFRRHLERACQECPRLLILEDLHWADGPSIAVLEALAPRIRSLQLALFLTARDESQATFKLSRLAGQPSVRTELLAPLAITDMFLLVESILGRPPSPDLVGEILRRSFGMPLFAREMAEYYRAHDRLPDGGTSGVRSVLEPRLAKLGEDERKALAVAALVGLSFDLWLVEAALPESGSAERAWIERAVAENILVRSAGKDLSFRFSHGLLRDAAEAELSETERATSHARLGRALAERHPDPDRRTLSAIARHMEAGVLSGEDLTAPLAYATLAARRAARDLAWGDVRRHAGYALAWIDKMPAGASRDQQELDLILLLCAATTSEADRAEQIESLVARARHLLERVDDAEGLACVVYHEFAVARAKGDHIQARAAIAEARNLDMFDSAPDLWGASLKGMAGDARSLVEEPVPKTDDLHPSDFDFAMRTSRNPLIDANVMSSFLLFASGRDTAATRQLREAQRIAESRGDARNLVWSLFFGSLLHELRRDWSAARDCAREIDALCERHALPAWWGAGTGFSLWFRSQKRSDEGLVIEPTARIVADRARTSGVNFRSLHFLLSGRIYLAIGEASRARTILDEGRDYCEQTDERILLPELLRALGRAAEARADEAEARTRYSGAANLARGMGCAVFELRARCDLIRLDGGRPEEWRRLRTFESLDLAAADRDRIAEAMTHQRHAT